MEKNRLEAFSDGVLAIIITIMILELKQPGLSSKVCNYFCEVDFFQRIFSAGVRGIAPSGCRKYPAANRRGG